jgi:hypothetical protein
MSFSGGVSQPHPDENKSAQYRDRANPEIEHIQGHRYRLLAFVSGIRRADTAGAVSVLTAPRDATS